MVGNGLVAGWLAGWLAGPVGCRVVLVVDGCRERGLVEIRREDMAKFGLAGVLWITVWPC